MLLKSSNLSSLAACLHDERVENLIGATGKSSRQHGPPRQHAETTRTPAGEKGADSLRSVSTPGGSAVRWGRLGSRDYGVGVSGKIRIERQRPHTRGTVEGTWTLSAANIDATHRCKDSSAYVERTNSLWRHLHRSEDERGPTDQTSLKAAKQWSEAQSATKHRTPSREGWRESLA